MGFLLYIASLILRVILIPAGIIFGLFKSFYDTHIGDGFKHADYKFRKMAISTDIYGNVYAEELLNAIFLTKYATFKFGQYGMTISAVLGYNLLSGTLTKLGEWQVKVLNVFEQDHCLKSIQQYNNKIEFR